MSKTNTQLTNVEKRELALNDYVEKQRSLFEEVNERAKKAGRPKPYPDVDVAMMWNIIKKGEDGRFTVSKRSKPLSLADFDIDENNRAASAAASFSYGGRMGMSDAMTPDETKLLLNGQLVTGLEIGEVQSAGCCCS